MADRLAKRLEFAIEARWGTDWKGRFMIVEMKISADCY